MLSTAPHLTATSQEPHTTASIVVSLYVNIKKQSKKKKEEPHWIALVFYFSEKLHRSPPASETHPVELPIISHAFFNFFS